jgi:hypothetical protein
MDRAAGWIIVRGLLVLAGLFWLAGRADAWCTMPPPANPGPAQPQLPNVAHKCWPQKWGLSFLSGQGYVEGDIAAVPGATTEGGHCAAWWCKDSAGAWNVESHCALTSYTVGGVMSGITSALGATDPVSALQAFADKYVVTLTDPGQINSYNCLHWAIQQQAQATKPSAVPPPVAYWVTSTTAYPLNPDGTRSITPWPTKALLHEPCDCSIKVTQFGATFCKVPTLSTPALAVVAGCGVSK